MFCLPHFFKLTNTLQKKLNEVRREKAQLEARIDREMKSHATLQTQLSDLRDNHLSVAVASEEEEEMEEKEEKGKENRANQENRKSGEREVYWYRF